MQIKEVNIIDRLVAIPHYLKLLKKYNKLDIEHETLLAATKYEVFKKIINKASEPLQVEKYKTENKKLRQQVKTLKEIIKEGK